MDEDEDEDEDEKEKRADSIQELESPTFKENEAIRVIDRLLFFMFDNEDDRKTYLRKRDGDRRNPALASAAKFCDQVSKTALTDDSVPQLAIWYCNLLKYFLSKGVR